jgi:hypothetical protein
MDPVTNTARVVYQALILRCKAAVKARTSIVFDPSTGVQKTFVAGKLTEVKHFTPRNPNANEN